MKKLTVAAFAALMIVSSFGAFATAGGCPHKNQEDACTAEW